MKTQDYYYLMNGIESLLTMARTIQEQKEGLLNPKTLFLRICSILRLSSREAETAWLADVRNAEACSILFTSPDTIKSHWIMLSRKLKTDTPSAKEIFLAIKIVLTEEIPYLEDPQLETYQKKDLKNT